MALHTQRFFFFYVFVNASLCCDASFFAPPPTAFTWIPYIAGRFLSLQSSQTNKNHMQLAQSATLRYIYVSRQHWWLTGNVWDWSFKNRKLTNMKPPAFQFYSIVCTGHAYLERKILFWQSGINDMMKNVNTVCLGNEILDKIVVSSKVEATSLHQPARVLNI